MGRPIYLDYAATSAIRPDVVVEAVNDYLRGVGATPGRSGHRWAVEAARVAFQCRRALAGLFGIPGDPGRIAFQQNATHALNTALWGTLTSGDTVVRTRYDHNAVRRPIAALRRTGVREVVLGGQPDGAVDLDELAEAFGSGGNEVRLLVVTHASNVLGSVLPLAEMSEIAHDHGALVLVDAAQTAGILPIDAVGQGIDMLAFTGHKGLLGPQGIGGLWIREGLEVSPLLRGGTGGHSELEEMPDIMPDRLEAGTQNGAGMAGLLAGVEWLLAEGVESLHSREMRLKTMLLERLSEIAGIHIHSPPAPDGVGIVTITCAGLNAAELAHSLDLDYGILTRAGLHCAPEAHALLGTLETGALRLSVGWATNEDDIERATAGVAAVCKTRAEER